MLTDKREITRATVLDPVVYQKLNEGLGGAYERVAYTNVIKRIAERRRAKRILEYDATYIAGVPGFNSCLLAQAGYDVTVAVNDRDIADTKHAWSLLGLKAQIISMREAQSLSDEQFDIVYNHLAFEHHLNPSRLMQTMTRLSSDVVITLTLSPYNIGFAIHWLNHKLRNKPWDHGYIRNSLISTMVAHHEAAGLDVLETGGCDAPPWMDTVDAQIGNSMTYMDNMPESIRRRWVWCSANPECQRHWLIRLFWNWESNMPRWFKLLVAHHLYVASVKRFGKHYYEL